MADVKILQKEVINLKMKIEETFILKFGSKTSKWNSNVENYAMLSNDINSVCNSEISNRFLKAFFYESIGEPSYTLRSENLDVLYKYAHGVTRAEFQNSQSSSHILISVAAENSDNSYKLHINIEGFNFYELLILLQDGKNVDLKISKEFLNSTEGLLLLEEMFIDNNSEFFLDYAFKQFNFLFPDNFKQSCKSWNPQSQNGKSIKRILDSIYQKTVSNFNYDVSDVDTYYKFHYLYNTGDQSNTTYLKDAYLDTLASDPNRYLYLCVIAYDQFFDDHGDEIKMLRHFSKFNIHLNKHNITRIFTLPCTKVDGKLISSYKNRLSNMLLFQYLVINQHSKSNTYLFLYDDEADSTHSHNILLKQDYVIRVVNKHDIKEPKDIYYNLSKTDIYDCHFGKDENEVYNRLYLALPEDPTGRNKLLIDNKINNILRYFGDFQERLKFAIDTTLTSGFVTIQIADTIISSPHIPEDLKTILQINDNEERLFLDSRERAIKFYDQSKNWEESMAKSRKM